MPMLAPLRPRGQWKSLTTDRTFSRLQKLLSESWLREVLFCVVSINVGAYSNRQSSVSKGVALLLIGEK